MTFGTENTDNWIISGDKDRRHCLAFQPINWPVKYVLLTKPDIIDPLLDLPHWIRQFGSAHQLRTDSYPPCPIVVAIYHLP